MTELNTLVGGNYSVAAGINNSGWVVGTSSISDDQGDKFRAVIWQNGNITMLKVTETVVSQYVQEIQKEGHLLPTRGNIHDLSGAITHKREIITLYLQGYLTPDIALKTNHSKEAVDRYIKDYHRVEILWDHGITELDKISHLSRLSKRVAQQYIDLLPAKMKNSISKNVCT
jgi:probable HAF family extracellular repeat protein